MQRLIQLGIAVVALSGFIPVGCDDDDSESQANPRSGIWDYHDEGIEENTCETDDLLTDPDTSFLLTNNDDGTFTVDQGAYEDFDCTIAGSRFDCPKRIYGDISIAFINTTLRYNMSTKGTFSSDTEAIGTQQMDIECEGAACGLAATFGYTLPCYYIVKYRSNKR
ncbi:MAG: hypothetical protein GY847_41640 [Proteobacteria bacterium]|nr:hypothetical protein [Pseudomonadota bacterium]